MEAEIEFQENLMVDYRKKIEYYTQDLKKIEKEIKNEDEDIAFYRDVNLR